jgi:hypothetical protein
MVDERDRLRRLRQLEAEAQATAQQKATEDAYYTRDPKTGLSPAQIEASQGVHCSSTIMLPKQVYLP